MRIFLIAGIGSEILKIRKIDFVILLFGSVFLCRHLPVEITCDFRVASTDFRYRFGAKIHRESKSPKAQKMKKAQKQNRQGRKANYSLSVLPLIVICAAVLQNKVKFPFRNEKAPHKPNFGKCGALFVYNLKLCDYAALGAEYSTTAISPIKFFRLCTISSSRVATASV